jgi:hypothetical protein
MLVAVGWWPTHIEFDTRDLVTVITVLNKRK